MLATLPGAWQASGRQSRDAQNMMTSLALPSIYPDIVCGCSARSGARTGSRPSRGRWPPASASSASGAATCAGRWAWPRRWGPGRGAAPLATAPCPPAGPAWARRCAGRHTLQHRSAGPTSRRQRLPHASGVAAHSCMCRRVCLLLPGRRWLDAHVVATLCRLHSPDDALCCGLLMLISSSQAISLRNQFDE